MYDKILVLIWTTSIVILFLIILILNIKRKSVYDYEKEINIAFLCIFIILTFNLIISYV
jgi:hypothetical protein